MLLQQLKYHSPSDIITLQYNRISLQRLYLISRSMLHSGDMSSKVFENFTTCKLKGWICLYVIPSECHNIDQSLKRNILLVSLCPPGAARSSVHTAEEWVLSAWSFWLFFPSQSAPQTGHSPPPAEPALQKVYWSHLPHDIRTCILLLYDMLNVNTVYIVSPYCVHTPCETLKTVWRLKWICHKMVDTSATPGKNKGGEFYAWSTNVLSDYQYKQINSYLLIWDEHNSSPVNEVLI